MKTHEQSNQRQDSNKDELIEGIIRLVGHYASQERSRAVREGLARRRERLRQATEKETR